MNETVEKITDRRIKDLYKTGLSKNYDTWIIQHYNTYKIFQETKKLVWATWILALVTIILAIITYSK